MAEVLFRFAADDGGAVGDGNDRAEGDAGVCGEGFGRIRRQRNAGGIGIGIARPSGHCADYDHAGRFGTDDEHAMITAPLLVGNLIGSSLGGFSGYNMFTGGNVPRDSNNNPLVNKDKERTDGEGVGK